MNQDKVFDNEFSEEIWRTTYKTKTDITPQDTFRRVAKTIASAEKTPESQGEWEKRFFELLVQLKFIPGGRIISNAGVPGLSTTFYNCFVSAVQDLKIKDPDSIDGIYEMLRRQAQTLKSEGGYGVNGSWIRPEGHYVEGIGSRTPGMLKFMELWDKSSEIITAGSIKLLDDKRENEKTKIRKGAQMLILECWHPEIKAFITAKQTPGRLTKFNTSVGITKGFMDAVIKDGNWDLKFPDTKAPEYKTVWDGNIETWEANGLPVIVYETVKAKVLWDLIISSTYNRAEPGVFFIDTTELLNPLSYAESARATNPCGEIPMATGVCCLGSLNLTKFVRKESNKYVFDFDAFREAVEVGIRFLDNVQDVSRAPLPEYAESVVNKRRIGLGVMGLGSLHWMLAESFASEQSLILIEKIWRVKTETEILYSARLGKEKGSFKLFDKSKHFKTAWWKTLRISDGVKREVEGIGEMRNSHQSMNAPTGNTGIFANCVSGGIEPIFLTEYVRWSIVPESVQAELLEKGMKFPLTIKGEWFETEHFKFKTRGTEQVLFGAFDGQLYEIDKSRGLTKSTVIYDYGYKKALELYGKEAMSGLNFGTTSTLSVGDHLKTLSIISHYTNQACSKTINVPNEYSFEDFKDIYLTAWKAGIKGITTYRDGTMSAVLESNKEDKKAIVTDGFTKRKSELKGELHHFTVSGHKYYVAVGLDSNGRPYECFTGLNDRKRDAVSREFRNGVIRKLQRGKYLFISDTEDADGEKEFVLTNGHNDDTADALTRVISLALRSGAAIDYCVHQLEKTRGPIVSFSKVLARTLKKYIKDGVKVTGEACPSCGSENLKRESGCIVCNDCGTSKCT